MVKKQKIIIRGHWGFDGIGLSSTAIRNLATNNYFKTKVYSQIVVHGRSLTEKIKNNDLDKILESRQALKDKERTDAIQKK